LYINAVLIALLAQSIHFKLEMVPGIHIFKLSSAIAVGILAFGTTISYAKPIQSGEHGSDNALAGRNVELTGVAGVFPRDFNGAHEIRDFEISEKKRKHKKSRKHRGKKKHHHHNHGGPHGHGTETVEPPASTETATDADTGGDATATDSAAQPDATGTDGGDDAAARYVIYTFI